MVTANWAGNVVFSSRQVHRPASVAQLQELVAASERVRALGTGHSFSRDRRHRRRAGHASPACHRVVEIDAGRRDRTRLGGPALRRGRRAAARGRVRPAQPGLAAAHLGGRRVRHRHPRLRATATARSPPPCRAVELVGADGELRTVRRGDDGVPRLGGRAGRAGRSSPRSRWTCDPTFDVRQWVVRGPARARRRPRRRWRRRYSVSLFTHWAGAGFEQVWLKQRDADPEPPVRWLGATRADGAGAHGARRRPGALHPAARRARPVARAAAALPARVHPEQRRRAAVGVPRAARRARRRARARSTALARPDRARCCRSPRSAPSPPTTCGSPPPQGRDTVALHFTWVPDTAAVLPVVAAVETRAGAVRHPAALGQGVRHRPGEGRVPLAAPARLREPHAEARPGRQVPQRDAGDLSAPLSRSCSQGRRWRAMGRGSDGSSPW